MIEIEKQHGVRFGAGLSTAADWRAAAEEVCQSALGALKGAQVDLGVLFVSSHHAERLAEIAPWICEAIGSESLIGCTGEAIVGGGREIENAPAISLWLAALPQTNIKLFHLEFERTPEGGVFTGWPADFAGEWPASTAMLLLGEPFSFPADELLRRMNEDRPGAPVLGGMASGGGTPGENRLILGPKVYEQGAVAALIDGNVRVRSVVSQGCRPIGQTYVITKAERNLIHELGGVPTLHRLQEVHATLSDDERRMLRSGLHVGRALSEYQDKFAHGDFLIRNVIGADPKSGVLAVGDYMRVGQTVQFHLRDEQSADDDLRKLLTRAAADGDSAAARGALLFTCNGRGTRLFSTSDHDAGCVREALGEIPVAGFFAQGEIGPVGGTNFLHGFTASVAVFEGL
ncbi:MAG TPA: FIST N-terminal domain-containing protein [Pirellulales bacterium]